MPKTRRKSRCARRGVGNYLKPALWIRWLRFVCRLYIEFGDLTYFYAVLSIMATVRYYWLGYAQPVSCTNSHSYP